MDIVSSYEAIAEALAFTADSYQDFNKDIQQEIELKLIEGDQPTAPKLANLKYKVNKRYYEERRAKLG